MWGHMALDGGMTAMRGITSFIGASREAKAKKKWQKYANAMVNIGAALNQNAITTNQINAVNASSEQKFAIDRAKYTTLAQAEVSAAVVDTAGRSVNQTLNQIGRHADEADAKRKADLDVQLESFKTQRVNTEYQATVQQDHSSTGNPFTALLGLSTDMMGVYQRHNPKKI